MRAIVLENFRGLDSLGYEDIPKLGPKAGHMVIEVKSFGVDHAESAKPTSTIAAEQARAVLTFPMSSA